jgi:hypothetical protein
MEEGDAESWHPSYRDYIASSRRRFPRSHYADGVPEQPVLQPQDLAGAGQLGWWILCTVYQAVVLRCILFKLAVSPVHSPGCSLLPSGRWRVSKAK